jgi:hypothetical protein
MLPIRVLSFISLSPVSLKSDWTRPAEYSVQEFYRNHVRHSFSLRTVHLIVAVAGENRQQKQEILKAVSDRGRGAQSLQPIACIFQVRHLLGEAEAQQVLAGIVMVEGIAWDSGHSGLPQ